MGCTAAPPIPTARILSGGRDDKGVGRARTARRARVRFDNIERPDAGNIRSPKLEMALLQATRRPTMRGRFLRYRWAGWQRPGSAILSESPSGLRRQSRQAAEHMRVRMQENPRSEGYSVQQMETK